MPAELEDDDLMEDSDESDDVPSDLDALDSDADEAEAAAAPDDDDEDLDELDRAAEAARRKEEKRRKRAERRQPAAAADVPRRALACVLVQVLGPRAAAAAAVEALNAAVLAAGGDALRIVAERAPSSAVCQWEDAVRGGGGVWDGAEAVVRSRLAAAKTAAKTQA